MSGTQPSVLIVGAGPTGLVLALRLHALGIALRIIDRNPGPGTASRAVIVHARTLEFYQQMGFADHIVGQGIPVTDLHFHQAGRRIASIALGTMGRGLSPYPFALCYPQDDHERFLVDTLAAAGIDVEWNTELESMRQDGSSVHARLRTVAGPEACTVAYICGCDGAHSRVRSECGIGFSGGTYDRLFYVADVQIAGAWTSDLAGWIGAHDFALKFPVRSSGTTRLIGTIPTTLADVSPDSLTFEQLKVSAQALLGIQVSACNWFSVYRVHHRVADRFRLGRAFVAGDAGHLHSPVGGQGMNTGIGDAINLAWKLAAVIHGTLDPAALDTYESERIAFARTLVATTDRIFSGMVNQGLGGRLLRSWLLPSIMPWLTRIPSVQRLLFRTVSQIRVHYRDSALSAGSRAAVQGGDRLPWVPDAHASAGTDNFACLRSMTWRVQIYGHPDQELRAGIAHLGFPLDVFPWSPQARTAGLARDAVYLVRPDGYLALVCTERCLERLGTYTQRWQLRPASTAS